METDTATDEVVTYLGDRYEFDYPKYITVDDQDNVRVTSKRIDAITRIPASGPTRPVV